MPTENNDEKTKEQPKMQRDSAKLFMADVISTLEAYDKKEGIEVRN